MNLATTESFLKLSEANYKGKHEDTLCRKCGAQKENIEHLFHCQNFKENL